MSLAEVRRTGALGRHMDEALAGREERSAVLGGGFRLPGPLHPRSFVSAHFGQGSGMEFVRGTTTLAFTYTGEGPGDLGGVVVAADSRASTGTYTASKTVTKILDIAEHMVATMAGGAADCQYWVRWLGKECQLYELRNDTPMTIAAASKQLANVMYYFKGQGLSMGSMVAGVDAKGPGIYFVDNDGIRTTANLFSVGSGSLNAVSVLDTFYKPVMSDAAAMELASRAICHATFRDAGSGGFVNLCHISAKGKTKNFHRDASRLYEELSQTPSKLLSPNQVKVPVLVPDAPTTAAASSASA